MKKGLTEIVAILDMSGSMAHLAEDTVGSFNSMLKEQQEEDREILVTTYVFNNSYRMIHDRVAIREISMLTKKDYVPSGCTALLDTMGEAITHIGEVHRYIREEDIPEHTIFFIITDGLENASSKFSSGQVKELVQKKEKSGWDFIYLASNIDAVETAADIGISREHSVDYIPDPTGTAHAYRAASDYIACACMPSGFEELSDDWREAVDLDFTSRK